MEKELFKEPCDAYYKIFTDKKTAGYKYQFLSPFELKDKLLKLAEKAVGKNKILNAGRGNPNFFSRMPRYAFALLTRVCTQLGDELCISPDLGFEPIHDGISKRFFKILGRFRKLPEAKFLKRACKKMKRLSGMSKDDFIYDITIATIGCSYPSPPRVLKFVEPVLAEFMDKIVYRSKKNLRNKVKIMPTEGAAAAILYVFNSLKYNGLVIPGDNIGVMTPIFSPYLELPALKNYNLTQICIKADENNNWEIPQSEIDKVGDTKMRALFMVNPTNPTSLSLSSSTVKKMAAVIRKQNPNLIILEDNVYAPFAKEFNSFFNVLPRNTIGVFSFSKYFGVTGWRLGSIVMHNRNIIDSKLLKAAPNDVHQRYVMLNSKPRLIKFMDRILADSRQVAEAHVAGLSTPQQTIMSLFATYDMMDKERIYSNMLDAVLLERMTNLLSPLEYTIEENDLQCNYYLVIDIRTVADNLMGGREFGVYLQNFRDPIEFLMKLAKKHGTVLLPAIGFAGPFWGVRVSLANLYTEDYRSIGENIRDLIDDYYVDFQRWENKQRIKAKRIAKRTVKK